MAAIINFRYRLNSACAAYRVDFHLRPYSCSIISLLPLCEVLEPPNLAGNCKRWNAEWNGLWNGIWNGFFCTECTQMGLVFLLIVIFHFSYKIGFVIIISSQNNKQVLLGRA